MARLLPHLSKEAETRLIVAVQQSNDFVVGADVCPHCGIDAPQHEYHCIRNGGTLDLTQAKPEKPVPMNDFGMGTPRRSRRSRNASREEQHGRYIDCGPGAWDDRE